MPESPSTIGLGAGAEPVWTGVNGTDAKILRSVRAGGEAPAGRRLGAPSSNLVNTRRGPGPKSGGRGNGVTRGGDPSTGPSTGILHAVPQVPGLAGVSVRASIAFFPCPASSGGAGMSGADFVEGATRMAVVWVGQASAGGEQGRRRRECVRVCVRAAGLQRDLHASWCWLVLVARVDSVHDFPCFRRKESGLGWCRVESLRQSGVESSYTVGRQAGRQVGRCGTTRRTAGGARECCPSSVDAFGGHSLVTFWRSRGERKRGSATESLPRERDGGTRRRGHLGPGISPTDASRRVVVGIGVSASPTKPESAKGKTGAGGGGRKAGACRS